MNYVYEGLDPSGELEQQVIKTDVFPLVRELKFKYDLSVVAIKQDRHERDQVFLANRYGLVLARVHFDSNNGGFNYYSTWYEKERGSDRDDRRTVRSIKLSALMNTLKKQKVIPDADDMLRDHNYISPFHDAVNRVRDKVGNPHKRQVITAEQTHRLLEILFDGKPSLEIADGDKNMLRQVLDKYVEQDNIKVKQDEEVNRFFGNCFMVGMDNLNQAVVGIIKYVKDEKGNDSYVQAKQFKRVSVDGLNEYPELLSYLGMLKTYLEGHPDIADSRKLMGGYLPRYNGFIEDLDMSILPIYTGGGDGFETSWMITPCSTTYPQ
jgi:hypothetical protein